MKQFFLSILLFLGNISVLAQKQANVWVFSNHIGLDFNQQEPTPFKIEFSELDPVNSLSPYTSTTSIADNEGNLLFYSDGRNVFNKDFKIMENGDGIISSLYDQKLIIPIPNSNNLYYLFTVTLDDVGFATIRTGGLHFNLIDINLEEGKGAVVEKNRLLFSSATNRISAVHHKNGTDIWLITHESRSNVFRTYLIDSNGISDEPVLSAVGNIHGGYFTPNPGGGDTPIDVGGDLKCSPDGRFLAVVQSEIGVQLFDFNNETGKVSNPRDVFETKRTDSIWPFVLEFSPNGDFLYFAESNYMSCGNGFADSRLFQVSTENPTTPELITSLRGDILGLQLAPNGKIFAILCTLEDREQKFLSSIECPNQKGKACNFNDKSIKLFNNPYYPTRLPNFIQSYFKEPKSIIDMPNVFTPNGDGKNDTFLPIYTENLNNASLHIYNRWGQEIYTSSNLYLGWSGEDMATGVYYWKVKYTNFGCSTQYEKGWVQLIK